MNKKIPQKVQEILRQRGFSSLRPSQEKAIDAGLFDKKNLLICTPTASGKTLVGELAILRAVLYDEAKALYVVPLKALASEKYRQFKKNYPWLKVGISSGDLDSADEYLGRFDVIITTSEKLDSLLRHRVNWMSSVRVLVVDEIHLLNDAGRGPTLEVVITLLKKILQELQVVGLSATIGNPEALASWLEAELVVDYWRPVELRKGVLVGNELVFEEKK